MSKQNNWAGAVNHTAQTKMASLAEVLVSVAIGYGIAIATQVIIFPWFGIDIQLSLNLLIGLAFTVVSIVRGYVLRRVFNWLSGKTGTRHGQSRRASLTEALLNVMIGYAVSVGSQALIFPLFGIHVSTSQNLQIGLIFTVVSMIRSYVLRRLFNRLAVILAAPPSPPI